MEYQINFGFHAFSVPSAVVDTLIRVSKENQLKVLLYLLRYPDKQFSVSQIASHLRIQEEQAQEALDWWLQVNILEEKTEGKQLELFPSDFAVPEEKPAVSAPVQKEKPAPAVQNSPAKNPKISEPFEFFSNDNIREIISASPELDKMIQTAKKDYYQTEIYYSQMKSLVWMYDYLGLPAEVILILLRYCKDVGRINQQRYIDTVASSWYEDEIFTPEDAERRVNELTEFYTFKNYICRLFELDARPSKTQTEFIELWQSMSFSEELLKYARDLSVEATGKVNFKYIHSVLTEWHNTNITELKDAEANHDEYIKQYVKAKKKGKKKKSILETDDVKRQEMEEIDEYLSLVNQFEEDTKQ